MPYWWLTLVPSLSTARYDLKNKRHELRTFKFTAVLAKAFPMCFSTEVKPSFWRTRGDSQQRQLLSRRCLESRHCFAWLATTNPMTILSLSPPCSTETNTHPWASPLPNLSSVRLSLSHLWGSSPSHKTPTANLLHSANVSGLTQLQQYAVLESPHIVLRPLFPQKLADGATEMPKQRLPGTPRAGE